MTQTANITALAQRTRDEFNTIKAIRGLLANLNTTDKSSLVAAINEVVATAGNAAVINDAAASATTTYSGNKIDADIAAAVAALVDSAPGALDTLNELAAAITANDGDIAGALTAIAGNTTAVTAAQTDATQALADASTNATALATEVTDRTAADAAIRADYGDHTHDFVADFTTGLN